MKCLILILLLCLSSCKESITFTDDIYSKEQVFNYIKNKCSQEKISPIITIEDKSYITLTKSGFDVYNDKYENLIFGKTYLNEARDCDDYANLYQSYISIVRNDDKKHAVAIGKLYVKNHVTICVMVDKELYIIEPESLKQCKLSDYNLKNTIYKIIL